LEYKGTVKDKQTKKPIENVIVSFKNENAIIPKETNANGEFSFLNIESQTPGKSVVVIFKHPNYIEKKVDRILKKGQDPDPISLKMKLDRNNTHSTKVSTSSGDCNCTSLFYAADKLELEDVRKCLDKGVNINCTLSYGQTALYAAALEGRMEIAELLLSRDANPNLALLQCAGGCYFNTKTG
jgi:hypothetical protein